MGAVFEAGVPLLKEVVLNARCDGLTDSTSREYSANPNPDHPGGWMQELP